MLRSTLLNFFYLVGPSGKSQGSNKIYDLGRVLLSFNGTYSEEHRAADFQMSDMQQFCSEMILKAAMLYSIILPKEEKTHPTKVQNSRFYLPWLSLRLRASFLPQFSTPLRRSSYTVVRSTLLNFFDLVGPSGKSQGSNKIYDLGPVLLSFNGTYAEEHRAADFHISAMQKCCSEMILKVAAIY